MEYWVVLSWMVRPRKLMTRPWAWRKSAPMMACSTSATMNTHVNVRLRSKLIVSDRVPYVAMSLPLAARRLYCGVRRRSWRLAGRTLTVAPVSIKNRTWVVGSRMWSRRLGVAGPAGSAAATGWRSRFPTCHMVGGNDERRRQNACGTSRGHLAAGVGCGSLSGHDGVEKVIGLGVRTLAAVHVGQTLPHGVQPERLGLVVWGRLQCGTCGNCSQA